MIVQEKYKGYLESYINQSNQTPNDFFKFWSIFNCLKLNKQHIFSKECEINIGGDIYKNGHEIVIRLGEVKFYLDVDSENKAIEQVYNPLNFLSQILEYGLAYKYTINRKAYIFYGRKNRNLSARRYFCKNKNMLISYEMVNLNNY